MSDPDRFADRRLNIFVIADHLGEPLNRHDADVAYAHHFDIRYGWHHNALDVKRRVVPGTAPSSDKNLSAVRDFPNRTIVKIRARAMISDFEMRFR